MNSRRRVNSDVRRLTYMKRNHVSQIDSLIRRALKDFVNDLGDCKWFGKEHDYVNRFAHGYLVPRCSPRSSFLRHPTQIGIEVAVRQNLFTAPAARKDLVLWPQPWMSCWNRHRRPVHWPTAVMEWKIVLTKRPLRINTHDQKWLGDFAQSPYRVGFSVTLNRSESPTERILVSRFHRGRVIDEWLRL